MTLQEIYLKTVFCCMACDGDIAPEEIEIIRKGCTSDQLFNGLETESIINDWIAEINRDGKVFLHNYLKEVKKYTFSQEEQLRLLELAIETIKADKVIEYSEIAFFKQIRRRLTIEDEPILAVHPDWEDYLLPDICPPDEIEWDDHVTFSNISIKD